MTSNRPYLIRALHEWIVDNGLTPQLLIDVTVPGVEVPSQVVKDGEVVLNISYDATSGLELGNEWILFAARFSGASQNIIVPVSAVRAIFVRENQWHMVLPPEEQPSTPPPEPEPDQKPSARSRLKVVK